MALSLRTSRQGWSLILTLIAQDNQKKLVDDKDDLSETQTQIKEQKEKLAASRVANSPASVISLTLAIGQCDKRGT